MQLNAKIVLNKKNDSAILSTKKDVRGCLSWKSSVDLDLHAIIQMKDGSEHNVSFRDKGSLNRAPFAQLDQDSGVGDTGGDNEENIRFKDLDQIAHAILVANIYNKDDAVFKKYDGHFYLIAGEETIDIPLISEEKGSNCILVHLDNSGVAGLKVINVNKTVTKMPTMAQFLSGNLQVGDTANRGGRGILGRIFGG